MGAGRVLLTDYYPLTLIGMANRPVQKRAGGDFKAVAGAKCWSTFVARMSCFVHPEEQSGLHR